MTRSVRRSLAAVAPFFSVQTLPPGAVPREPWQAMNELVEDPGVLMDRVAAVRSRLAAAGGQAPDGVETRVEVAGHPLAAHDANRGRKKSVQSSLQSRRRKPRCGEINVGRLCDSVHACDGAPRPVHPNRASRDLRAAFYPLALNG